MSFRRATLAILLGWLSACTQPTQPTTLGPHRPEELPGLRALAFQRNGGQGIGGQYHCRGCHEFSPVDGTERLDGGGG